MDIVLGAIVVVGLALLMLLMEANRGRAGRNPPANYPPPQIPEPRQ